MVAARLVNMKQGRPPKGSFEVLHMVCERADKWEQAAAIVASADAKKRPVIRHQRFTIAAALEALTRRPMEASP